MTASSRRRSAPALPRGFGALWVTVALDLLGFGIILPILPLYATRFSAGPVAVGLLFSAYAIAQTVASPLWGRLSDRVGRKPVLVVTLAGSTLGSLLLGIAGSLPVLFLGRVVDGASGASVAVARSVVADVAAAGQRARLMGLLGAAFGVGFVLGPALGAAAVLVGPRIPFFLAAGVAGVNTVVTLLRLPSPEPTVPVPRPRLSLADALRRRGVSRLLLATLAAVTGFSGFEATFALLGARRLGMTDAVVAVVFVGVGVVVVAVQGGLVGPAARRVPEEVLLRAGLTLDVAGFVTLAGAASWPVLLTALLLLAVGQGLVMPVLASAVAGRSSAGGAGLLLGAHQSANGFARVVGPALAGSLFAVGPGVPYVAAAALGVGAIALVPGSANRAPGSGRIGRGGADRGNIPAVPGVGDAGSQRGGDR